ncbi:hypothetical protein Q8F55_001814 [Vanrija albida]|uniref:Uncharacterized protein n=1 Tax=Vanrija albida TaxID=181172 RepID=A0ABR3Q874_9TREE
MDDGPPDTARRRAANVSLNISLDTPRRLVEQFGRRAAVLAGAVLGVYLLFRIFIYMFFPGILVVEAVMLILIKHFSIPPTSIRNRAITAALQASATLLLLVSIINRRPDLPASTILLVAWFSAVLIGLFAVGSGRGGSSIGLGNVIELERDAAEPAEYELADTPVDSGDERDEETEVGGIATSLQATANSPATRPRSPGSLTPPSQSVPLFSRVSGGASPRTSPRLPSSPRLPGSPKPTSPKKARSRSPARANGFAADPRRSDTGHRPSGDKVNLD